MKWFFSSDVCKRMVVLFSGDLLFSIFSLFICACKISGNKFSSFFNNDILSFKIPVFTATVLIFSFYVEVYTGRKSFKSRSLVLKSLFAGILTFVSLTLIYYFFPNHKIDSKLLIYSLLMFFVLQSFWHTLYYVILNHPLFTKNVLIVGVGTNAETIGKILEHSNGNFKLKGYIRSLHDQLAVAESRIIGDFDSIFEVVKKEQIHTIVMALNERRVNLPTDKLLRSKLQGVNILEVPSFYELLTGKLMIEGINPSWFLYSDGFCITMQIRYFKRISDLFFSIIGLFLSLPFWPIIAFIVKISSRGPVFYKQIRTGAFGKNINIYKFRTMMQDAESVTGAVWSGKNDPRVTWAGKFLRKTRFDELPQLFNVLKGDMSFIGPRPERPELVKQIAGITQYYPERHFVKPGLTGWAQIKYPYGDSFGDSIEKLRYDLYYVKNISISLDLMIVIETVKVIIFRRGGR